MYVIPNTFSGFGSMTVRNTNMVTMSSFVVMIQCIFHEKRSKENRNTIIYVIMKKTFKHWIVNIPFIFNIFKDFSSGSVWELYLLSVMILIALFCNLMSLCVLKPHSKMLLLKCGAISELYMISRVYFGRKCFSLFITPNVRDILFAILSIYRSQFSVSWIVIPRKTNC